MSDNNWQTSNKGKNAVHVGNHNHDEDESHHGRSHKTKTLLKVLTRIQRLSAPFISLFLAVHLAAPIAANFGGSDVSNKLQLLGREYYQTRLTEPLLLFIPLGIHIGAGVARRFILGFPKRPGLVTQTAWLAIGAVPIHIFIHRIAPSFSKPPISSFSPSEMNFEFVKVAFAEWPTLSWLAYSSLVGIVLFHMFEGANIIKRWLTGTGIDKRARRAIPTVVSVATLGGLYWMTREPVGLRGLHYRRILEIHREFPTYRLLGSS